MTRFTRRLATAPVWFALLALALAAGCEKRPTGYDPNPNTPEGVYAPDAQLLVYRNAALRVMVRDYASTNVDSVVVGATAFPGSTEMPLLKLLDGTAANTFEMFRRNGGGKFERTTDYDLQSEAKYLNAHYESFSTTDPAPGSFAPSSYMARGLLAGGAATHQSPLSNESRLTATDVLPITYNGDLQPLDSLFTISWVGVPGAVGYWVHIYEKPIAGGDRLTSSLPAPIAYITAADEFIGYRPGNSPGSSVQFKLGDTSLLTLKYVPALLGHEYYVRVSGVNSDGQIMAQTPGNLDSLNLSADLAYLAPPGYSPEKTKVFFSLGGTKVVRRPPAHLTDGDAAQAPAPEASMSVEHHSSLVRFPWIGPFRAGRH